MHLYNMSWHTKGQVVADFTIEHRIDDARELDMSYLNITPWTMYFDGLVCNEI
jgi:hypothetical protein